MQKIIYVKEENKPLIETATQVGREAGLKSFSDIVFTALEQYTKGQPRAADFSVQEIELDQERIQFIGCSLGTENEYEFFVTAKGKILVYIQNPEGKTYSIFETVDEMVKNVPVSPELFNKMRQFITKPVKRLDI